ncbi:YlxM family DNA-binding protein [Paramaledivibacter caminithermalis]|jgi:predicted DNA-binding protein YlxM (UPF0122 family)|uniref:UPF0122 protein SAMN02745912_01753 n=1 Tax=Paramaledivibacter caminithermalis (strain DSM 15212 / CIP 107654 / DViRD3) TaxID=1121301 RepID=A0A1M6NJD6_PARC5|nr:YlxM family DNA-binding protein [Paramaledivibacter caminithermalis]SHJ95868.1 hypothetical protein SAMN02745912_01753 [Paramaledivibacter caminithermalis DSM 15212]
MFEKKIKLGNLYAFYGSLLTEKQQEILRLYCIHDLSLGEISENLDISRQAVYDTLKRSKKILEDYEGKLGLLSKFSNTRNKVNQLIKSIDSFRIIINDNLDRDKMLNKIDEVKELLVEILDEGL